MRYCQSQNLETRPSHRVAIVGAGIITSLGIGYDRNAEGFRNGRLALRPVTLFDTSRQRVHVAGEVSLPADLPPTRLTARQMRRLDRASRMLLLATHEAWTASGWRTPLQLPVVMGTTSGGMPQGQDYYFQATRSPQRQTGQATRVLEYQVTAQLGLLGQALGWDGPCVAIANACASGANAIGHAWQMVRAGQTDRVLTGGYDALSQLVFAGFDSLQALSPTTCRPFDANRDGLALGEGAAVLALERMDLALSRRATVLGEIVGYAAASDLHHNTQPHPEGRAALRTMNEACRLAGLTPDQIGYLNAHGTGTPLNDAAECQAILQWAGPAVSALPVSSTKGSIGHLLGAAGAVEALLCLMALREGWMPPNVRVQTPDPNCHFRLLQEPTKASFEYAMSNSFGFGGANATLILHRPHAT